VILHARDYNQENSNFAEATLGVWSMIGIFRGVGWGGDRPCRLAERRASPTDPV
jgi:hypothetical protein